MLHGPVANNNYADCKTTPLPKQKEEGGVPVQPEEGGRLCPEEGHIVGVSRLGQEEQAARHVGTFRRQSVAWRGTNQGRLFCSCT